MPRVTGWSEDEFDDRAQDLAALIRRVWRAIARLIAAQAEQQSQVTLTVAKPILPQWQQAVDGQIIGFVRNMYLDAAGTVSDALDAPDELLIGDDLVEVYTNAARNRLVGIGDDVWKNVQAQIALGNQSGESIAEIAARIRNVAGVSEGRSLTIARTEVHAAHEAGSYEQAVFVDPDAEKTWLATEDARTRPSHRAVDGQTVKIGEAFNVGGSKLRYPGDPLGAPEDCINCRCSVAYNFDMITTVIDEPEPAMVAAGEQMWKAHQHPRGNDGKFIKSGIVADFLKKSSPNIIDVTKAVGNLDSAQWGKLTDAQKTHIKSSVDKLPKGTITHDHAKKTLDSLEKVADATAPVAPKPKTKIGETYAKLKDAKHGDVLATGTKYNSAGVAQKFKITADKTHVHPDYMPHGKMKLEFLKKNGETGQSYSGNILTISQKLHPLPAKGKKPGKVEWDELGATTVVPEANAPAAPSAPDTPNVDAPSAPTKIPTGLKGAPGDPAKITTGVVWAKHPAGTTIVESDDGSDKIVWNGKKYEFQSLDDIGDWATQFEMSKKDFYAQHKEDTGWKVPGGEKTHQPLDLNTPEMEQAFGDPDAPDMPATPDEALGHEPTPDEVDWQLEQWERQNTGHVTPEPPSAPQPQAATVTPKATAPDPSKLTDTGQTLGSHEARVFKDDQGNSWLFKAQDKFATSLDVGASELQSLAGRPSPETYAISLNGKSGSIQRMLPGTGDFGHPSYFNSAKLSAEQRREVLREQPIDWLLSNFDAHSENFINLPNGQVLAIDKGNGLKFFGQDSLTAYSWQPNEHRTVYSNIWRDYAAGKYDVTSEDLKALSESIDKLQAISDDDLKAMFRPYAEQANAKGLLLTAKSNPWAENLKPRTVKAGDVEAFLDALVARKNSLKIDFSALYGQATTDRNSSPDISKKSIIAPELTPGDGFKSGDDPEIVDLLDQAIGDTDTSVSPDAASAKAKLQKLYDKGLITQQEFIDAAGEEPDDPYDGIADKGVLLNDLEGGGILSMPQAIDLGIMLNESDYNDLSNMEKDQLEASLSTAADMNLPGGKESYAHWQSLHNATPSVAEPITTDEPDTSGPATSPGGALYYLDNGDQTKMVSSDGKFVLEQVNSPLGKYSLETKQDDGSSVFAYINDAEDVEYTTGQTASLWYPAKNSTTDSSVPSGPMVSGASLGLKDLHNLIANGKHSKKYTDGQVVATSPDGKKQFFWDDTYDGYGLRDTETGSEQFMSNIHVIKKIRDDDFRVPEDLLPNHSGQLVEDTPMAEEPSPNDPVIDTDTIGMSNHGALLALENGDIDELVTLNGEWSLKKHSFSFGDSYVVSQHHENGNATTTLFENPDELEGYSGLQVWYPKQEIDQSVRSPDATAGVSSTPVDLDIVQEKIDLGEYTAGETIGITKDGQYKITYSPFLNGLIYQHKVGNTGDDDMDWDSLGTYDGNSDTMDTPVSEFVDANPDVEFFDPQSVNAADTDESSTDWGEVLSGSYSYNDVVAQTDDGTFKLVHKGMGNYSLQKNDSTGAYNSAGVYYTDDILNDDISVGDVHWTKVNPGTQFKSGKVPAKKMMPAKKVAKAVKSAGVPKPGAYTPAAVTANEKKFYLEDAEWGSLVPVEAIHLLNGDGGLDVHEAGNLTPTQTGSINTQLEKALANNMAGAQAAWDTWAGFEQQLNGGTGYDASKIADHAYFLDVENDMWAGDKSTGDVFAITPDGKYRLVIHSTEGPFENPDSFALEQHGPLGWELNKLYSNTGYGGPPGQLAADTDTMSKTWLKSDGTDTATPTASPVSFDPPGTGTQLASTIFGMMSWVPEGKTLLVGKDNDGNKYKMTAAKDSDGNKVINVDYWSDAGTWGPGGQFKNEAEYTSYYTDDGIDIKWDAVSELPDKSALDDFMGNPNSPATPAAPAAPTAPLLPLTSNNVDAIWDKAQTLDIGTVIGTTTTSMGNERRLLVGLTGSGVKTITVQQKDQSGNWKKWNDVSKIGLQHELNAYIWTSEIHDTPTLSSPSPSVGKKLTTEDDADQLWDAAQTLPDGTVLATGTTSSGVKMRMVVATDVNGNAHIKVEKDYDDNGSWQFAWNNSGAFAVYDDLVDNEFYSAIDPDTSPSVPTSPVLDAGSELTQGHGPAFWAAVQNLGEDTVVATATAKNGSGMQMVVKKHADGHSILVVNKKHPVSGKWGWWYGIADESQLTDDLSEEDWHNEIDVPGVPDASASPSATTISDMTGTAPNMPIGSSYWAKLTSIKDNVPGGTVVAEHKNTGHTLVKTYDGAWAVEDADGAQIGMNLLYPQDAWNVVSGDWHTPSTAHTLPSATTTPTVPNVSTPPAPKLMPINKAADVKAHLKANGNLGYYSKPENIWAAIKEWQSKPGNEQYSPMDIFKSLDNTLKTAKPNPFQEKMTKWAASKKGAQIIGADGIYGPQATTPAAPTPTSPTPSVPTAKSMSTISGDSANDLWSSMEAAPVGTVFANGQMNPYKYRMVSVTGNDGSSKVLQIQFQNGTNWSPYETFLTKEKLDKHLKMQAKVLSGGSYGWKPTLSAKTTGTPKATVPDIEAGGDISGFDEAKQKSVYDAFKAEPFTYLSSPEHSIFDAFQSVVKSHGLTFAQAINIVDEQGAKKVSKPNAGLFKQKLVAWLQTPEAAAHILNEPTVVTGLAKPPSFHPKYDPYLNPGQIPSFEESSKLTYDYVPSSATATKIWSDMVKKTSDFSPAEKKALTVWTGGAYNTINGHLMTPNPGSLSSTHKSAMTGSQLGMRPSDRPMVLVRGTGFAGLGNAKNHAQLEKMVGTTWRNNAFAASSVGRASHDEPGVHSPAFSSFPLWIEFEAPPGTPMAWVTPFSSVGTGEREMLLAANLHYKILSVEKKMIPGYGMKTIARVRIVPKPEGAAA